MFFVRLMAEDVACGRSVHVAPPSLDICHWTDGVGSPVAPAVTVTSGWESLTVQLPGEMKDGSGANPICWVIGDDVLARSRPSPP